jgi:uncharacterized protein YbgA (DUF1722 family)
VGECGINWRDYLYRMEYWQILLHIRGFYHRNILQYQLQRMNVWASMYCMGNPDHRTPDEVVKLYFDNYRTNRDAPISEKEHAELMDILDFYQEQNENESKK